MSDLRARKKREVRRALIESAVGRFRVRGVDRVSIREIAAAANVSQATFFNYFPSKTHLVDAFVCSWLAGCVPPRDGRRSLRQEIREYVREIARRAAEDRDLLVMLWSRTRAWRGGPTAELAEWVAAGQRRADVRADIAAESLAALLSAAIDAGLGEWLLGSEEGAPTPDLAARLMRGLDIVLDGCRKRHERVRARAAASPAVPPPRSA